MPAYKASAGAALFFKPLIIIYNNIIINFCIINFSFNSSF